MKKWLCTIFIFCSIKALASDSLLPPATSPREINIQSRQWLVTAATVVGYGGSFIVLNKAWYNDYPKTGFHTFNDGGEWLQIDKVGHAWTTYHTSRFTTSLWRWAGVKNEKAVALGTGSSLLYMLSIEYLDGRSSEWGWSWGDVGSNVVGATLFAGQELKWKEQKVSLKFSSYPKTYSDPGLKQRSDDLYGTSYQGRLLKDYNAQTYWLSANVNSLFGGKKLPSWLNVAVGYGAEGMFGGFENRAFNKSDGTVKFDRRDIKRYRQWFLAPDVDLTKINVKAKWLRTVLAAFNVLKFPSPALEFSNGKFSLKALAY